MTVDLETAARYRQHAKELRTVARAASSASIRTTLLQIALDYEHMAATLEEIDRTNELLARKTGGEA